MTAKQVQPQANTRFKKQKSEILKITAEIDVSRQEHETITRLRNAAFPEHQVARSYYKQLPHMRVTKYRDDTLVGYMGLDYRVINVAETPLKILGIIDFCIDAKYRGKGIGSAMLTELSDYARTKDVDFIILISDLAAFYTRHGFTQVSEPNTWLRLHEHQNYGVATEHVDDLFIKSISGKVWNNGSIDWLGYMY